MDGRHMPSGEETSGPRHAWLIADGRAYRLDHGGLPKGVARDRWTIVDARHEDEALRLAEEYRHRSKP